MVVVNGLMSGLAEKFFHGVAQQFSSSRIYEDEISL
jgi:hypothetical protein